MTIDGGPASRQTIKLDRMMNTNPRRVARLDAGQTMSPVRGA
jgi:hypothetical protein